jgi:asparagine synthase (glutamine-hydrolysing)
VYSRCDSVLSALREKVFRSHPNEAEAKNCCNCNSRVCIRKVERKDMCGIVGQLGGEIQSKVLVDMSEQLRLRGPDGGGIWVDTESRVGFAHRRLAVVDLSSAGDQPMTSPSGRYVLCLNGEIYNHVEQRNLLDGETPGGKISWRGSSDTETLLSLIEHYGLDKALDLSRGMFAFGLWDRADRTLTLARDRMGEKPLYYGWVGNSFVFASDLAAIKEHPDFDAEICPNAVGMFLRRNYVPAPLSIYKGVYKLPPATLLQLQLSDVAKRKDGPFSKSSQPQSGSFREYWSLRTAVAEGRATSFDDDRPALEALDAVLGETLRMQARADVPVGAFLSGGVDSSLIVALIKHHVGVNPTTFTIGFDDKSYNESEYASAVAQNLGTDHHELIVGPKDVIDVIPKLSQIYTEPFADSSQIPTYLVSQLARKSVTVSLSGDAGDEIFGGYNRYKWAESVWPKLAPLPFGMRNLLGKALMVPSVQFWDKISQLPTPLNVPLLGGKVHKISKILTKARNIESFYAALLDEWDVESDGDAFSFLTDMSIDPALSDSAKMMYWDSLTYLPDDILCKVDRAAMGVSLETRAPFLDYHVIETAMRLAPHMRIRNGETKWALRQLLYQHVPRSLIERPKAGFGIPVGKWITGPLRDWAESLLDETALADNGMLDSRQIRERWNEHLMGKRDWTSSLWGVLMLQALVANAAR